MVAPSILEITFRPVIGKVELGIEEGPQLYEDCMEWDLDQLADRIGATVAWDEGTRTAYVHRKSQTLVLPEGSKAALLLPERKPMALPFAPYSDGDRLHVPLRGGVRVPGFCGRGDGRRIWQLVGEDYRYGSGPRRPEALTFLLGHPAHRLPTRDYVSRYPN